PVTFAMSEEQKNGERTLEIHLGDDGEMPTDPKAQRLKSWANIIATTAALLTAVAAIFKPQDQTVNRNTYEQLRTAVIQADLEVKQNHDDMVALHNYLAGYFANNSTLSLPPLSSATTMITVVDAGAPPAKITTVTIPNKKDAGAAPITFNIQTASSSFPLPEVHPPAAPAAPLPPFDSVAAQK
ncbi:MAG: hypothetical protein ACREHV_06860, partial [Rhizomicrobium sp.]